MALMRWVTIVAALTILVLGNQHPEGGDRVGLAFGPGCTEHLFDQGDGLDLVLVGSGHSHAPPLGVGVGRGQHAQVELQPLRRRLQSLALQVAGE